MGRGNVPIWRIGSESDATRNAARWCEPLRSGYETVLILALAILYLEAADCM